MRSASSPATWPRRSLRSLKSSRSATTSAKPVSPRGRVDQRRAVLVEAAVVRQAGERVGQPPRARCARAARVSRTVAACESSALASSTAAQVDASCSPGAEHLADVLAGRAQPQREHRADVSREQLARRACASRPRVVDLDSLRTSATICSITSTSTDSTSPAVRPRHDGCRTSPSNSQSWAASRSSESSRMRDVLEQGLRVAQRAMRRSESPAGCRPARCGRRGQPRERARRAPRRPARRLGDAHRQRVGAMRGRPRAAPRPRTGTTTSASMSRTPCTKRGSTSPRSRRPPSSLAQRDGREASVERMGLSRHPEAARGAQPDPIVADHVEVTPPGRAVRARSRRRRRAARPRSSARSSADARPARSAPIDGSGSHREEPTVKLPCMIMRLSYSHAYEPPRRRRPARPGPALRQPRLRGRDLLRVRDLTADELDALLDLASELKDAQAERRPHPPAQA